MMSRYTSILALFLTVVVFASTADVANAGNLRAAVSRDNTTKDTPTSTNAAVDDTKTNKAKKIEAKSKSFRDEMLSNRAAVAVVSKTGDKKQKERRRTAEAAKTDAASDRPADRHRKVVKSRRTAAALPASAKKKDTATAKANQDDDRTIKDNSNNNNKKRKAIDQDRRAKIVQRRAESLHARKNRSTATKPLPQKQEEEDEDNDVWNNILSGTDTMIDSTADEDDAETTSSNNAISPAKTAKRAEAFRDQVRAAMTMKESFKA
mmetsp:Transcript_6046/g.13167  ORF Transcript_6046/g.13167 Transcript_6046/m.13167 type:complete len:264 (-) Transcript_6046:463-1254(-)